MAMVRLLLQGKLEAGESRGKKMLEVMVHLGACALQSCSAPTHTCTVTHTRQSIRSGVLPPSSLVIFSYPFVSPFPLPLPSPPSHRPVYNGAVFKRSMTYRTTYTEAKEAKKDICSKGTKKKPQSSSARNEKRGIGAQVCVRVKAC